MKQNKMEVEPISDVPPVAPNFTNLATSWHHDDTHFPRVMPNVMDQCSCSHFKDPRSSRADISNHPREIVSDLQVEYGAQESLEAQKLADLLVRHESNVAMKTEVAARRLERIEKEKDKKADMENEANLEQAVEDKSKVAKLV